MEYGPPSLGKFTDTLRASEAPVADVKLGHGYELATVLLQDLSFGSPRPRWQLFSCRGNNRDVQQNRTMGV